MGRQIIKQPNDKYAVWSSVIDDFIIINATPDELIEGFIEEAKETIKVPHNTPKTAPPAKVKIVAPGRDKPVTAI